MLCHSAYLKSIPSSDRVFCRQAFWESYSKAANDAAQALAARRNKEAAVRDLFKKAVSRLIPPQVGSAFTSLLCNAWSCDAYPQELITTESFGTLIMIRATNFVTILWRSGYMLEHPGISQVVTCRKDMVQHLFKRAASRLTPPQVGSTVTVLLCLSYI